MSIEFKQAVESLKDSIWFTRAARIHAEARLLGNDFHAHMLLVLYSIYSIALSVVLMQFAIVENAFSAVFSVVLSVALLSLSLSIGGRSFKERAAAFKKNYIVLHRLHLGLKKIDYEVDALRKEKLLEETQHQYIAALQDAENHTGMDDKCARFCASRLTTRKLTGWEYLTVFAYYFSKFSFLTILYAGPVAAFVYAVALAR
jgi:hypothetical protein